MLILKPRVECVRTYKSSFSPLGSDSTNINLSTHQTCPLMMGQPQPLRAAIGGRLLNIATALIFIPLIIHVIFLVAGTFQVDNSLRPGSRIIGLSSFSIVSVSDPISHFQLHH